MLNTKKQFVEKMVKVTKNIVDRAYKLWEIEKQNIDTTKVNNDFQEKYPAGFKDFLQEYLDLILLSEEEKSTE